MDQHHFLRHLFDATRVLAIVDAPVAAEPGWRDRVATGAGTTGQPAAFVVLGDGPVGAPPPAELAIVHCAAAMVEQAISTAVASGATVAYLRVGDADPGLRARWLALATRSGIRLFGPGSLGFVRPSRGLDVGRTGRMPAAGNVALVSQSGALAAAIVDWSVGTPVGFSLVASLGCELDVCVADVLDYLASDRETKAVVLYLEAIRDARGFMSALRALASAKPVVVLRGGRDELVARQVRTHSGALCGSNEVYRAALRRAGAVQVGLLTQMFTAARYLAAARWPVGRRLAVVANGNGPALLAADQARDQGVQLGRLSASSVAALAERFGGIAIANPLNLGLDADGDAHADAIRLLAADQAVDAVLVLHAPAAGVPTASVSASLASIAPAIGKPLFTCWLGAASTREHRLALDAAGLPSFATPETAVDAFSTVTRFYENQRLLQQSPELSSDERAADLDGARSLIAETLAAGGDALDEIGSKALLGAFHVPLTQTTLARTPAEAVRVAEQTGFPVAMKVAAEGVGHKSALGGVALNVHGAADVRASFADIVARVRAARPGTVIEGVTVQAMNRAVDGVEVYVGLLRDPLFGPVIAFGAGGTRVEVIRDTTLELPPLNAFLANRMIRRTRIGERLIGRTPDGPHAEEGDWRGGVHALERILVQVSTIACELPEIAAMDLNPVIVDPTSAVAVDAGIVVGAPSGTRERYGHLAVLPYPAELARELRLADGASCLLRPIRSEDAGGLQRFVRGLSDRSRYFRFISTLIELTPRMLVRYTQIDYDRELAFVAVIRPEDARARSEIVAGERIIGVVRYLLNPDRKSCEFAIVIDDAYQGRGLGSQMMQAIVQAAAAKGLERIEGFVLSTNRGMLDLMRALGFRIEHDPDDPTMRIVSLDLRAGASVPAA